MGEYKYFVSTDWLKEHLKDEDLFVIDSRFDLFDPANYGHKAYAEGHIEGAYYFDIDEDITEDKGAHGGRRGTPDAAVLGAKLAAIGVNMDSVIVCYDDTVYSASRTWWQLRYMGYENVCVLNGGYQEWCEKGYPVSREVPASRGQGTFEENKRGEMFACKNCIVAAIKDPDAHIIVDSRGPQRYSGEVEPLYSKRGHIPGAINIHYLTNMKDGSVLNLIGTPEQWKANFAPCLEKEDAILYCGSAIEAAVNFLFLSEIGYAPRLYVGSMSDWVTYDDLEVEASYEQ